MAIFLSYSRRDEKAVKAIAQGFESARRQVWLDADLGGGDAWWDKILHNIRSCSVFVFALSDASMDSKPCQEELAYATALHRPIVPVQVGPVRSLRASPLSRLQVVQYRVDEASAGFEVLAAVDSAARRAGPLPLPPPQEPPIPYAYLQALGRQIDAGELDPQQQRGLVDQLRKALGDEADESVRQDILAMLKRLANQPWVARRTEQEIRGVILAHAPSEAPTSAPDPPPAPTPVTVAPPAAAEPSLSSEPDGRAIFEQRMAVLRSRQETEERRKTEQQAWHATPASVPWGGASWSGSATSHGTWGGVTPTPQPVSEPQPPQPVHFPATQLQPFSGQPFGPHQFVPAASTMSQPAPPNHSGLCITALVLSLPFLGIPGGVALYFSQQVGQRYAAHDYPGAMTASGNAKTWAVVGIVLGALFMLGAAATGA